MSGLEEPGSRYMFPHMGQILEGKGRPGPTKMGNPRNQAYLLDGRIPFQEFIKAGSHTEEKQDGPQELNIGRGITAPGPRCGVTMLTWCLFPGVTEPGLLKF